MSSKHKLMIKTHNVTGLKYLCYTRRKNHEKYLGSGKFWRRHLKEHGYDISTELLMETEDFNEFKSLAISKSLEFDIVNSNEWANLKIEEGDGGDTVSKKRWITDGKADRYLDKNIEIPEGWRAGRSNCVFNDKNKQKEFCSRVDREYNGKQIKKAWDEGRFNRDHSKCGTKGDKNPAKRPEVRLKIQQAAIKDSKNRSERMKANKTWELKRKNV